MKIAFNASKILFKCANGTKKILWILGSRAFWVILFFIFIDLILGGLVFYKYVFLAEKEKPAISQKIIKFDEKTYQEVLIKLQTKEQNSLTK